MANRKPTWGWRPLLRVRMMGRFGRRGNLAEWPPSPCHFKHLAVCTWGVCAARQRDHPSMFFDRTLMWSSVATRHLLESRLHIHAAVEAMADMEGFLPEYQKTVSLRAMLDDVFLAVEDKTLELIDRLKDDDRTPANGIL